MADKVRASVDSKTVGNADVAAAEARVGEGEVVEDNTLLGMYCRLCL